jgi:hypothetical protein
MYPYEGFKLKIGDLDNLLMLKWYITAVHPRLAFSGKN